MAMVTLCSQTQQPSNLEQAELIQRAPPQRGAQCGRVDGSWSASLSPALTPGKPPPAGVQTSLKVDSALFACLDRGGECAP